MKGSCPLKTSPDWTSSQDVLGENRTWELWMTSKDGVIPEPSIGAFYFFVKENPALGVQILNQEISKQAKVNFTFATSIVDMISNASEKMFQNKDFKQWAIRNDVFDKLFAGEEIVRTPEQKVEAEKRFETLEALVNSVEDPHLMDAAIDPVELQNKIRTNDIIINIADKISVSLSDKPYVIVTAKEAALLLQNSAAPYNNEPIVIHKNMIYYISDRITLDIDFAKIASPFLRLVKPKVVRDLYDKIAETAEGQTIIQLLSQRYPKIIDKNSDLEPWYFKEKVILEALSMVSTTNKLNKTGIQPVQPLSKDFTNVVNNNILYQIRQAIRGNMKFDNPITRKKVTAEKIKSDTTLDELSDILNFKVTEKITQEQFNAEKSDADKAEKELLDAVANDPDKKKIDDKLDDFLDSLRRRITRQFTQLSKVENKEIRDALADPDKSAFLTEMLRLMKPFRKDLTEKELKQLDEIGDTYKAKNLVNTLFTLEKVLLKANSELKNILDSKEDIVEKQKTAFAYQSLLEDWLSFIKDGEKQLRAAGIPTSSFIYGFVSRLDVLVDDGIESVKQIKEDGAVKHTTFLLNSFSTNIRAKIDKQIEEIKNKKGDAQEKEKALKKLREDREKYYFDEEKIRKFYKGELGDSNWWSNMFVSYSSDPDPIIGGFAMFLKHHLSQIVSRAVYKGKTFAENVRPDMQLKNMNNVNYKKDWQEFTMVDKDRFGNDVLSFAQATKGSAADVYDLRQRIIEARKKKDKDLLKYLYLEKADMESVMNRDFTQEYYDAKRGLIEADPEAYDALEEANEKIEEFKIQNPGLIDSFENNDVLTQAIKDKERLYSIYDDMNQLKDEKGQKIARSLMDHRKNTKNMYVAKERKGAFQTDLNAFIELAKTQYKGEQLFDYEGNMTPKYWDLINEWIDQNTVVRYTPEYYKYISDLYTKIAALTEKLPKRNNLGELLQEKAQRLTGFRDSNGQIDPGLMDTKQDEILSRVHDIQQMVEDIKYQSKNAISEPLTMEEQDAVRAITEAFIELDKIQYKKATDYYVDIVNEFLPTVGINGSIDGKTANGFIGNTKEVEATVAKNPKFKEWFDKNHVKIKYRSNKDGKEYYRYKRIDAWTVAIPHEVEGGPELVKKTKYTINGVEKIIEAVPVSKYFYFDVHPDFRTIEKGLSEEDRYEKYIGKVIDNMGNYLPLTKEQAAAQGRSTTYSTRKAFRDDNGEIQFTEVKNKTYINEDYYTLISDSINKNILDKVTRYHLDNQIGTDYSDRLYLNLPRVPVHDNLEGFQTGALKDKWVDRLKGMAAGFVATITGKDIEEANKLSQEAGDVEEGFANATMEEEREELVTLKDGIINPIMDKIPVKGLSKLPIEKQSYDVIGILNFYMLQLERKKELTAINPIAKAIVDSLENADEAMQNMNMIREKKQGMVDKAINLFKGGKSSRAQAIRALYNREFYGEVFSEKHLDWLNKLTGAITGGASMNYFALNLPSAIKNYWGALWQMTVEAAAGEYFNAKSMMAGKLRAKKAMYEWSSRIYGGNYDTVDTQLILMMDMIQGKAEEVVPKDFSRSFAKDIASISWLYSPRKFMEMEGALQLGFSIMNHIKVKQKLDDGRVIEIPYADAFEINKENNRLVLKSGITPEVNNGKDYGIKYDAKGNPTLQPEFLKVQNIIHEKYKDLNGAFAKFEQPQAQRYFAYRLFAFMRRYFTHMFMHRFGKRRPNYALEDIRTGYYTESVIAIANILRSLGASIPFMAPSEAASIKRFALDIAQIMIVSAIAAMIFGYDDDDEDRFNKLKAKSGALGDEDFRLDGWLSNHALVLLLKTQSENQSFIPLPRLGLNNYLDLAGTTSIAFGPTITAAAQLLTDLAMHAMPGENEHLYYQRDTGPYSWQKEGSAKIWNHLFTTAGFSGSQVSPIKGLQSFETFSRM